MDEEDLFGDEISEPRKRKKGSEKMGHEKKKRKVRDDISMFFEKEAVEADGSDDSEEDGVLEGLIDDSGAGIDHRSSAHAHKRHREHELSEVSREMDRRGNDRSSMRAFNNDFLLGLQEKYRSLDEASESPLPLERPQERQTRELAASTTTLCQSRAGSRESPRDSQDSQLRSMHYTHESHSPGRSQPPSRDLFSEVSAGSRVDKSNAFVVPDSKDPKLWCVKTFRKESELCVALLLKAGECFTSGKPCPLHSAFHSPHLKGYMYVEAHKEVDVRNFVRGIRGINPWQIKLVPGPQMAQVFKSSLMDADMKQHVKVGD